MEMEPKSNAAGSMRRGPLRRSRASQHPARLAKLIFFGALAAVVLAVLVLCDFLRFPLRADELHFWPTSVGLFHDGFPSIEQLRTYNELSTPLPFLVFGGLDYVFHAGIIAGRAVNLASSVAVILLIGAAGAFSLQSILCVAGLVLCPYFLLVGAHLYTDPLAVLFTVGGLAAYLRKRHWPAALCFIAGIACRQYIVAFPLALLARELVRGLRLRRVDIDAALVGPALAGLSLAGWYLFFGAAAPQPALQAQGIGARLYPEHGLYFLACIGVYFVLAECLLFRSAERLWRPAPDSIAAAIAVSALFLFWPPIENVNAIVPTMGYFDIALRSILPTPARIAVFWLFAVLACLRFRPLSLGGLMLYANALLMAGAHVAWDKYALPLLAALWLLKSADQIDETKPASISPPMWRVSLGES
jgi:hypothetical protein